MAKQKYYAVRVGRTPGIYMSWAETEKLVKGFPGAQYKSFSTRSEAQLWMETKQETRSPKRARPAAADNSVSEKGGIILYTDGGASGNPGPGGWGAVVIDGDERHELSGGYRCTTNNRMELLACISALEFIGKSEKKVVLHSDSSYVVNGIEKGWARSWKKKGWRKSDGTAAKNIDLWGRLLDLLTELSVRFVWVKGHAGNVNNERCDELAVAAWHGKNLPEDIGYEG